MTGWYDGGSGWALVAVALVGAWSAVLLALISLFRGSRPPDVARGPGSRRRRAGVVTGTSGRGTGPSGRP